MANLSAISFHARKGFVAAGVSAKLSHVQELVAAALGHNTLASYQTASEDTALAGAAHVVLDTGLLEERASKLGLSVTPPQLLDVVSAAAKIACPAVQIHASVEDFGDVLQAELVTVNTTEATAFGAALLAAVGTGTFASVEAACEATIRVTGQTAPGKDEAVYQQLYPLYRELYPDLKSFFARL